MIKTRFQFLRQIVYVFVIHVLLITMAKRNFRLDIETLSCKQNSVSPIGNCECSFRRDKDNITKVSMFMNLIRQVEEFYIQFTLYISREHMPRLKLFDMNINACSFLKTVHRQKLFQNFLEKLESVLNVVPRCPLKAPFNYTITDYYMDVNQLPPHFPAGSYRVYYLVYYRDKLVLSILSTGGIIYD